MSQDPPSPSPPDSPATPGDADAPEEGPLAPSSTRLVVGFTWRFLFAVAALSTAVYADKTFFEGAAIGVLTSGTATAVAFTLSFAGFPTTSTGNEIHYQFHVFKIIEECVGLEVLELFAAAILAFPVPWRDRLRGLLTGLPILFFINFIRMITLVLIGAKSAHALEIGHLYVWPLIVIAVAIGLWLSWAWSTTDEASPPP
jgi:exosortase/archaeosortase family protein